jgi:flagellar basal-body rod protein FlgF
MDRLIYTAMTGAAHLMNRQAAVAHNLANVTSSGYRAEEHRMRAVDVETHNHIPEALQTRAFAVDTSAYTDFSAGPMNFTGRTFDVAVQGKGWIALAREDGSEAYTRNGNFEISANGILQSRDGIPVQGDGGPITIPPDVKVSIGRDGTISVVPETGAQSSVSVVGRIKLVNPPEDTLERMPDGNFRVRGGDPAVADERVQLADGYLEGSNVNPVSQMVTMISLARQFEMQMKLLSTADLNDRAATQVLSAR